MCINGRIGPWQWGPVVSYLHLFPVFRGGGSVTEVVLRNYCHFHTAGADGEHCITLLYAGAQGRWRGVVGLTSEIMLKPGM